ncbi:MAG: hypothetical protein LIP04_07840 [Tannerellaceae bacterium]|nr:hypothetical protein [Tannerellaceae bacterium]
MANAFQEAGLKPIIHPRIQEWLITHYVVAAGLSAGITATGSGKSFVKINQ